MDTVCNGCGRRRQALGQVVRDLSQPLQAGSSPETLRTLAAIPGGRGEIASGHPPRARRLQNDSPIRARTTAGTIAHWTLDTGYCTLGHAERLRESAAFECPTPARGM
jgi:hypothetical protein